MNHVRTRATFANVVAMLALFIALGGTSYAAFSLPRNSVGTKQLRRGAVSTVKIKDGAVTARKLTTAGITVPTSSHAVSADSAVDAAHARNADAATRAAHAAVADHALAADAVPPLRFTNLTLKNGWVGNCAGDGTPAIAKSSEGVVYLRGSICRRGAGSSPNPFAVPPGLAPSQAEFLAADQNFATTGRIQILTDGEVLVDDDPSRPGSGVGVTHLSGVSYTLPF